MVRTTALAATAGEYSNAASQLLTKGRKSAARLHDLLGQQLLAAGSPSTLHGPLVLTEQILCCFDRALAALHGGAAGTEDDAAGSGRKCKPERGSAGARASASSKRIRVEKKSTMHDNFLWRKYGQKEIKNSKYPRFYYRCSYRDDHGCTATKQVQQSEDDDPSLHVVTYFGEHFCGRVADVDGGPVVAGDDGEESEELMVISFGSSVGAAAAGGASAYPWPCCGEDAKNSGASQPWSLPDWEEVPPLTASVAEELIEESTPEPELMGLISSPDLEYSLLDLELGESSFGIDGFISFDELSVYSIDNAR
uniref:WRKY domain-containing protein n=1 Tax=Oryza punctata TaxID=4537 RepID=A0A0E0L3U8_ORYPU